MTHQDQSLIEMLKDYVEQGNTALDAEKYSEAEGIFREGWQLIEDRKSISKEIMGYALALLNGLGVCVKEYDLVKAV